MNSSDNPTGDTRPVRVIFMGTPDFAVPSLSSLYDQSAANGWEVVAVATQPDRPAGRGNQLTASPIKQFAVAHSIPCLQPLSLRKDPAAVETLRSLAPDLLVVAAYGLILPRTVLEIPTFGCINVHASLLPAYRGASPITAALLNGEPAAGVSIMLMDEGMDTGPVLRQAQLPVQPDDTTATLSARLADLGATLLVETLPDWLAGDIAPIPQADLPGEPSICRLIKKEAGLIDWAQSATQIERMTRAYTPWPAAYTLWRGEAFKVISAAVVAGQASPGHVVNTPAGPAVGTGSGVVAAKGRAAGRQAANGDTRIHERGAELCWQCPRPGWRVTRKANQDRSPISLDGWGCVPQLSNLYPRSFLCLGTFGICQFCCSRSY